MLEWIEGWAPEFAKPLLHVLLSPPALACLGVIGAACFVASLFGVPYFLSRLPSDYFSRDEKRLKKTNPRRRALWKIAKNVLGSLLLLAGVAMLILPGQGLLTLFVALLLLDFPGKRRFENWLVERRGVLRTINALRRRARRPPLRARQGPRHGGTLPQ